MKPLSVQPLIGAQSRFPLPWGSNHRAVDNSPAFKITGAASAGYIKLLRPEGEIDFVASPNLTNDPFEVWELLGRQIKVETSAEIVAKKLWHRGDRATARDLFDLALVIEREPMALATASSFLTRHRAEFLKQVDQRKAVLKAQFEAIDTLDYRPSYEQAAESVAVFLLSL